MNKAIMMSIQPKWVEKILNGEKTIEVRKTAPKFERECSKLADEVSEMYREPIKVYIYCTKGGDRLWLPYEYDAFPCDEASQPYLGNALLDEDILLNGKVVAEFTCDKIYTYSPIRFRGEDTYLSFILRHQMRACLTEKEIVEYGDNKKLYGWHISDLKIYDKPRELGEFRKIGVDGNAIDVGMKRPMQSWGYVQEEE